MTKVVSEKFISLEKLCSQLSISVATGRNWVKLGKIKPAYMQDGACFFPEDLSAELKNRITLGENAALKSRRNKKYVSGNGFYASYISQDSKNLAIVENFVTRVNELNVAITDEIIATIIVYFARQLYGEVYEFLIKDIIDNFGYSEVFIKDNSELFEESFVKEDDEDILGLLYLSLRNLGDRKSTGAYYTPTTVVKRLCSVLFTKDTQYKSVLDPCCGTGNFILQLPKSFQAKNVYASDIDLMSVLIARVNFAIKFNVLDRNLVCSNIKVCDYLVNSSDKNFDYIIGNPPWGFDFSEDKKLELKAKYESAKGSNVESYDVVVEQALSDLAVGGVLSFVLPEAFLNVKTHTAIREFLMKGNSISFVEYLGEVFDGVQCPSIIIQITCTSNSLSTKGLRVVTKNSDFVIQTERDLDSQCFSFLMNDYEYKLICKISNIENKVTLKDNSIFALGIVTGDNSRFITSEHTKENELILKGTDISKFKYKNSGNYIKFVPEEFQQVAPVEVYRAEEKLFYKFISNKLVFAYDNRQTLSLNSCNILIPQIDGLSIKYVMAILNSKVAQFFFAKQFNSIKVLRFHLEQIPIPFASQNELIEIEKLVDEILSSNDENYQNLCENLDDRICDLYGLTEDERMLLLS